jgi:ribonuclease E
VFSEPCEHCNGRGVIVHSEPLVEKATKSEPARVHDAAMSAAASAGAAKVHAAARRAGAGEQDELDADSAADDEPTADAVGPETPVEEPEDAPRRVRAARRRATRAAGSVTPAAARADAAAAADAEEDGVAELV